MFADTMSLLFGFKKAEGEGRKATMAVIGEAGWNKDPEKLESMFNSLSETQKQGHNNYAAFWEDFSKGNLDKYANRIFIDLYHNDEDFTFTCDNLNVKPVGNAIKVGKDLIEKGANIVIDVLPGNLSTVVGIQKDIFQTTDVTLNVAEKAYKGTLETEDVQKFMLQWASNAVNYCDRVQTFVQDGNLGGFIEDGDINWWGQEFANVILNEGVDFGEKIVKRIKNEHGVDIEQYVIEVIDKATGAKMDLLMVVDSETGKTFITTSKHEDGTFKADPMGTGEKKVTGVNENGDRSTEKIVVEDTKKKVKVELDTTPKERDDEPANGNLTLMPDALTFSGEGETKTVKISTNYLYYGVKTEDDWLMAKTVPGTQQFTVTATQNLGSEQRTGKVYVLATNREGKVLKTTTLSVTQDKSDALVQVTPSSLTFTAKGGSEVVKITCPSFSYCGGYPDVDVEEWVSVDYGDEAELVITVKENTTNEERSGFVIAFGTNTENPTYDDIVTASVLIKQEAAGTQPGGKLPQFEGGRLEMRIHSSYSPYSDIVQWKHKGTTKHTVGNEERSQLNADLTIYPDTNIQNIEKNEFTVTTSGNRIYIKSVQDYTVWKEDKYWHDETTTHYTYDFDITLEASDFSKFSTYKLIDIRAKKYYDYHCHSTSPGDDKRDDIVSETDVELHVNASFDECYYDSYGAWNPWDKRIVFSLGPILPQYVKKWDWSYVGERQLSIAFEGTYDEQDSYESFLLNPDGRITLKLDIKTEE
jgi:hypothetical protein